MSSFGPGSGNGGDNVGRPSESSSSNKPWVWVLIPVGIVLAIGAVAFCLHSKRRKARRNNNLPPPPPLLSAHQARSRAFNERDLESSYHAGGTRPGSIFVPVANGRAPGGPTNRWFLSGPPPRQATEEGLNELGEAPPPYEKQLPKTDVTENNEAGPAPKSQSSSSASSMAAEEGVEMHALAPAMTGRTMATTVTNATTVSTRTSADGGGVGRGALSPFDVRSEGTETTAASSEPSRPGSRLGYPAQGTASPPPPPPSGSTGGAGAGG